MVLFTKIVKTQRGEAFVAAGEVISIMGRLSSRSLLDGEARRPGGESFSQCLGLRTAKAGWN